MNQHVLEALRAPAGVAAADPFAALPAITCPPAAEPSREAEPAPADVQAARAADPSRRWSASTAVLEVHRDGDRFQVRGKHEEIELPLTGGERYGAPRLALAELVKQGGEVPTDVIWLFRQWSKSHNEIVDWIGKLRRHIGDDEMRLIVWDDTGLEIPWELLWIDGSPGDGLPEGWLGSLVPVVRWTTIHDTRAGSTKSPYSDTPAECRGEVAAYLADEMAVDQGVLRRFGQVTRCSAAALLDRLAAPVPALGLVYVASHGVAEPSAVVRGRLGDLKLTRLDHTPLPGLTASRSLVFLNACHSGRLYEDERLKDSLLRGFAQVFLQQGAAAVIGTTGAVGEGRAREMAHEILDVLAAAGRPHVAVALRDARARVAAAVPDDTDDERLLLPFLYTFMYVCYGNARTSICLVEGEG
jgi:hypothetical protein